MTYRVPETATPAAGMALVRNWLDVVVNVMPVPACPSCKRANPSGFRFCGSCGAELEAVLVREVRKAVTVLFADITGSTALAERLDPEALRLVMSRYFDEMRSAIELHGGTVEKFIGDAVMAVFGIPRLHEDDALRAVRAAWDMNRRIDTINQGLEADFGVRLSARIGVNTGEVVTGDAESGERYATGDPVNVAARLEQVAQPGEILLGELTWRLTRHAVDTEPTQPLDLKGKNQPVPAHRLLAVRNAFAVERRVDAPLVGRQRELGVLRDAFDDAVSQRRCLLVTVLGPPGIGKSRLARELVGTAGTDAITLTGQCLPYGEGITYWPLQEIFAALGAEQELDEILRRPTPEEIAWAVRKALEQHARERFLVLMLEDVHWAEPTLLDLVEHLVDWTRHTPLLLVCLARLELLDRRPAWAVGRENARSFVLPPLSGEDSEELIGRLLGGGSLQADLRSRVHAVAEGNPLFVEQLLAMIGEGAEMTAVPPTIQALLATRLDALPERERELIERASVVGLEFEWEAVAALSPDGHRPAGGELGALVRKELIRPHESLEDVFRFRHILIRDAAYDRLPKQVRSDLHDRLATWLESRAVTLDEIIGYHLEQAHRYLLEIARTTDRARSLAERAANRLTVAGRRASSRGDATAAQNLLGRAAALLPIDHPGRADVLASLGAAMRDGGEMERAEAVLTEAVERGREVGDEKVVAAADIALTDLRLHRHPRNYLGQQEVRRATQRAIEVFERLRDDAGLALALGHRGKLQLWAGRSEDAIGDLERAVKLARSSGDALQEAESVRYLLAALYRGPTAAAEALARVASLDATAPANRRLQMTSLAIQAVLRAMGGDIDTGRRLIAETRALAGQTDVLVAGSGAASAPGEVELLAGDYALAERELRPSCDELERIGELGFLSSLTPLLTDAVFRQGRVEEALRLSDRWPSERLTVPEDADAHIGWHRVRAKVLATSGDLAEAERLGRRAVELATTTDFLVAWARALADLGVVLGLAGRHEEARDATAEAIRLHERKGNLAEAAMLRRDLAARGQEPTT